MSKWDDILNEVVNRHMKKAGTHGVTANKMVDLCNFAMAFDAFVTLVEETPEMTLDADPGAVMDRGIIFAKRMTGELQIGLDTFLKPHIDSASGARFRMVYNQTNRGGTIGERLRRQAGLAEAMFPWMVTRPEARQSFKGKGQAALRAVAGVARETDPVSRLAQAAVVIPVGAWKQGRKWIETAAEIVGAPLTDTESVMADAATAQQLGDDLARVNGAIQNTDPANPQGADLQGERLEILSKVQDLADSSKNPDTVLAAAATGAAHPKTDSDYQFRTKTGADLGMTPDQEDAMMVSGKGIIAAGAGSGKTHVLAGKVVYMIKELSARSSEIIATSFSAKSAAELVQRVRKYGGDGILEAGEKGFGTTHSIGRSMCIDFSTRYDGKNVRSSDTTLIKKAMKQVLMMPQDYNLLPDPDALGMFEGIFDTMSDKPQDDPVTPDAAPAGGLTFDQFQRFLEDLSSFGDWAVGKGIKWGRWMRDAANGLLGADPADLDSKEREFLNKIMDWKSIQKKLPKHGIPSNHRFGAADGKAKGKKKGSPFWQYPANMWFNRGYRALKDSEGRAIGAKRAGLKIGIFQANLLSPGVAWDQEKGTPNEVYAAIYGAYEWLKKGDPTEVGQTGFDDMLQESCRMMIENPAVLATMQSRYKHILVDEAQDLNKMQHLMFGLIAGTIDPETQQPYGDGRMTADTFVFIGDDKQAIYEFRGAIPEEFIAKSDSFEGDFETKMLELNWRSGKNIVDAANRLIAHNDRQIPMTCTTRPDRGDGQISYEVTETHAQSAALAAERFEQMIEVDGWPAAATKKVDYGIAVRTNAEAYAFGVELLTRGIPFRSKMNFFNDYTTRAIVAWMQVNSATKGRDLNEAILGAKDSPRAWLDDQFATYLGQKARGEDYYTYLLDGGWRDLYPDATDKWGRMKRNWRNEKNVKPFLDNIQRVRDFNGPPMELIEFILSLQGAEFKDNPTSIIEDLVRRVKEDPDAMDLLSEEAGEGGITEDMIRALALAPIDPLMGLAGAYEDMNMCIGYIEKLQKANEKQGKKDDPKADDYYEPAVVIDTCHGWKGLEARQLFVPMAAGVFPHALSVGDPEQMASERRLAYVALTRGQDSVTVLCPKVTHLKKPGGVSEFVDEACIRIPGDMQDPDTPQQPRTARVLDADTLKFMDAVIRGDLDGDMTEMELEEQWAQVPGDSA